MDRPNPLEPAEAFEVIQRVLDLRDSISLTSHVRQRMRERQFTVDDIRHVLVSGTVAGRAEWNEQYGNWRYQVSGRDCDGVPLVLVVAIEPAFGRITIITGKDD